MFSGNISIVDTRFGKQPPLGILYSLIVQGVINVPVSL